ncbi:MAG TPA: C2 family cysteine protease, partial [Myxococcota bacterium]
HFYNRVVAFQPYSYDGGVTNIAVDSILDGPDLDEPMGDKGSPAGIANFKNVPLMNGGVHEDDVIQGATDDCYMMAMLAALAREQPGLLDRLVLDLGDGTYAVRFYQNGNPVYVRVDADFWVASNGNPYYAHLNGALWPLVVEKAYAFFREKKGSYASIEYGNGTIDDPAWGLTKDGFPASTATPPVSQAQVQAWYAAGHQPGTIANQINAANTAMLNWVAARVAESKPLTTGGLGSLSNTPDLGDSSWRRGQHIYAIDDVHRDSNGNPDGLILRNPYTTTRLTLTDATVLYYNVGRAGWLMIP